MEGDSQAIEHGRWRLADAMGDAARINAAAAAAGGCVSHTPVMVITGASGATEAEVSSCPCGPTGAGTACGGGALWACPHTSVPIRTHSSQLLRITQILQDWSTRKVKMLSTQC